MEILGFRFEISKASKIQKKEAVWSKHLEIVNSNKKLLLADILLTRGSTYN